ncbi:hypothetical protein [Monoglobus pectinilyticus]|uniref:hypothetical protein n=1 Tax=Monoglobus pectinilyticus TaxID=1981510 RepID=UPI001FE5F194|nr:hypothetical protein [Monoglobus pectinilyticus]
MQRSFCFRKYSKEISDVNKAALSDYVAHRKIIIDLLSTGIRKIDNEKFSKEEFIHNLIFPMKCSSDDIDYESHNLWLIDERLAYSSYVASDVSLNTKKMMIDLIYCYWIIRLLFLTSRMMEQNLIL